MWNDLRDLISVFLAILLGILVVYIIGSLAAGTFDISEWATHVRTTVATISLIWTGLVIWEAI